ncbi:RNA polymerase sigma factor [Sporosarcina phage Lietuvens]|nr:RNA polymerase sigma factor [Sporosarcina phage Lietuvens]
MRKGIASLLKDYYRLETRSLGGDFDTTVMLADLMSAVNGDILTVRQRQYIALYFFCGLSFKEIAVITGASNQARISDALYSGIERISVVTKGESNRFKAQPADDFNGHVGAVYRWLDDIAYGAPVGEPTRAVVLSIASILQESDELLANMTEQARTGVVYVLEEPQENDGYVHLSDSQMRWQDRRMSFVPEVFPPGDAVGSKRVVVKYDADRDGELCDDDEHITRKVQQTGRRRMFKLRGN